MFHNRSNCDYHFIIKELAEKCEDEFTCLRENTEKYITFPIPIQKQAVRIDKKVRTKSKKFTLQIKIY